MPKKEHKKILSFRKIGEKIVYARLKEGMKQKELSELLGCSQMLVSLIETGKTSPYKHIEKISQITNMPISWFLGENMSMIQWKAQMYDRFESFLKKIYPELFFHKNNENPPFYK